MKIQSLLEQTIYRYQRGWEDNPDERIAVEPREERRSLGSKMKGYAIQYGFELNSVKSPRRWASTFCTTSIDKSLYLNDIISTPGGIRQIEVEQSRICGYVGNDFVTLDARRVATDLLHEAYISSMERLRDMGREGLNVDANGVEKADYQFIEHNYDIVQTRSIPMNDEGYSLFKMVVERAAKIFAKDPSFIDEDPQAACKTLVAGAMQSGKLGVAPLSAVPDGNYEVWFEGPYTAVKI